MACSKGFNCFIDFLNVNMCHLWYVERLNCFMNLLNVKKSGEEHCVLLSLPSGLVRVMEGGLYITSLSVPLLQ